MSPTSNGATKEGGDASGKDISAASSASGDLPVPTRLHAAWAGAWRRRKDWIPAISLYLTLALVCLRSLLLAPGLLGLRHDWPIPPYSDQLKQWFMEGFYFWSERSLGYQAPPYGLPLTTILFNSLAFLGMDGSLYTRLLVLGTIWLAGVTMWFLARTLRVQKSWALVAGAFYSLTPVLFEKIDSGYIHYMASYAIQPAALAFFIRSAKGGPGGRRDLILAGLFCGLTWYQPQFVAMVPLEFALWCLVHYGTPSLRVYLKNLGADVLLAVSLNATILVSAATLALGSFDTTLTPTGQTVGYWSVYASRTSNPITTLFLLDPTTSYFKDSLLSSPLLPVWIGATVLLFGLIYAGAALRLWKGPGRRPTLYFILLSAISSFLGKGLGAPFGDVTFFLFVHLPPLQAFREFGHALALGALGTAALLGLNLPLLRGTLDKLTEALARRRRGPARWTIPVPKGPAALGLSLALIAIYSGPMLTGDFAGNVQTYDPGPETREIYNRLAGDPDDYRVMWIPMAQPVLYPGARFAGVDPILQWSPKPSFHYYLPVNGAMGPFTQFLAVTVHENRTQYLGDLLAPISVRYVVFREGVHTAYQNFSGMRLLDRATFDRYANESKITHALLQAQVDLVADPSLTTSGVSVWSNLHVLPRAYAADRVFLAVGDLSLLVSLSYMKELPEMQAYLGDRPTLIFLSQLPRDTDVAALMSRVDGVILDPAHIDDLALALVPSNDRAVFDHLESYADLSQAAPERWASVQQTWSWRDWHYAASLDDPVLALQGSPLDLPTSGRPGVWHALVEAFPGPRAAPFDVFLGEKHLMAVNLSAPGVGAQWLDLGTVFVNPADPRNKTLRLVSRAGIDDNRALNPSFEEGWDDSIGAPVNWSRGVGTAALDSGLKIGGDFSVRLTTAPGNASASLLGAPVPVLGGSTYKLGGRVKAINAVETNISLEGWDPTQGIWLPIGTLPPQLRAGTSWYQTEAYITVPERVTQARVILQAGTARNATRGGAVAWFEDIIFQPQTAETAIARVALVRAGALEDARAELTQWMGSLPVLYLEDLGSHRSGIGASGGETLPLGPHGRVALPVGDLPGVPLRLLVRTQGVIGAPTLKVDQNGPVLDPVSGHEAWVAANLSGGGSVLVSESDAMIPLDLVAIYIPDRLPGTHPATTEAGASTNPTLYHMEIKGPGEKMVVFAEAYDRWWEGRLGGETTTPIMVNGGTMGFWFHGPGEGSLVLEYLPQRAYFAALLVMATTSATASILLALAHPGVRRWRSVGMGLLRLLRWSPRHR